MRERCSNLALQDESGVVVSHPQVLLEHGDHDSIPTPRDLGKERPGCAIWAPAPSKTRVVHSSCWLIGDTCRRAAWAGLLALSAASARVCHYTELSYYTKVQCK